MFNASKLFSIYTPNNDSQDFKTVTSKRNETNEAFQRKVKKEDIVPRAAATMMSMEVQSEKDP